MLVHSTSDNLENGEGREHVHEVELVPRRSDLPYRYVSNVFLKRKISPPCSCQLIIVT